MLATLRQLLATLFTGLPRTPLLGSPVNSGVDLCRCKFNI
jgi:hypothetical protein